MNHRTLAAEDRCSEYVRGDYGAVADEEEIAKNWGGWWSPPMTGRNSRTGRATETISLL